MYELILKSYEPVVDAFLPRLESALPDKTIIQWNYANANKYLGIEELMMLYMGDIDLVLVRWDRIEVSLPDSITVQAIMLDETNRPLALISLKDLDVDFSSIDERKHFGKVYIVGFGPGHPDLLTIKAHRLLHQADIIFYDDLLDHSYLDQFRADKQYVGKRKGKHSTLQGNINHLLYGAAIKGKNVVRIKGGDPLIFGRGGEEYYFLNERFIDVEIVPGVTSALAAAADSIIPLTCRGVSTSVAFTLGHDAIHNKLPEADTLVFYMGASQQKAWAKRLIDEGWQASTPVAAVRNASLPDKEIKRYTLGQLQNESELLPAPCLVIVGHTATSNMKSLRKKWLYVGSDVNDYKGTGMVVHNPMIGIQSIKLSHRHKAILTHLETYDRLVFASPFAVVEFFNALYQLGFDARHLNSIKISSIGTSTSARLKKFGLNIVPESDKNSIEGMLSAFKNKKVSRERILLPCSTQGFNELPERLRLSGHEVEEFHMYENILPDNAVRHNLDEFSGVVFTSPTTIKHFFDFYGEFPKHLKPVFKGEYSQQIFKKIHKERFVS